jgi:hypothetical protein
MLIFQKRKFNKDAILLNYILNSHKYIYENTIDKSFEYNFFILPQNLYPGIHKITIFNKELRIFEKHNFIPFGYHKNKEFIWCNGMNNIMLCRIKKMNFLNNLSKNLIKKIFSKKCKINNKKYIKIIPYIVSITNSRFNVIQFTDNNSNIMLYSLIDLNIN